VTPSLSPRHTAACALVALTLIWSFNWIVLKTVLQYSGPFDFSALRYIVGTLVLVLVMLVRRESFKPPPILTTAIIGFAQTAGFQALVQWALVTGGAGKTALLAFTMPFWVVLFSWLILSDRPGARQLWSLAIAALGLVFIIEPWHGFGGAQSSLLALGGGVLWGLGVVLSKRLFQRCHSSALSLTTWQMFFGALLLCAIALAVDERPVDWAPTMIAALAYNGVLSSGIAWLLWSYVVEKLPANVAGLSSLAVPIVGIGFAWAILHEVPSAWESSGIVAICIALAIVNVHRPAQAKPVATQDPAT